MIQLIFSYHRFITVSTYHKPLMVLVLVFTAWYWQVSTVPNAKIARLAVQYAYLAEWSYLHTHAWFCSNTNWIAISMKPPSILDKGNSFIWNSWTGAQICKIEFNRHFDSYSPPLPPPPERIAKKVNDKNSASWAGLTAFSTFFYSGKKDQ